MLRYRIHLLVSSSSSLLRKMGKDLILQKPSAQLAQKVIIHNEEERFWVADDENGLFQGPSF